MPIPRFHVSGLHVSLGRRLEPLDEQAVGGRSSELSWG